MKNDIGLKENGKYVQIINDFVMAEEICNMNCDYCLAEDAKLKDKHTFSRTDGRLNFTPSKHYDYLDSTYKNQVDSVLKEYNTFFSSPILKISGGEVLMIKNIDVFLEKYSALYETVQILTNGVLITENLIKKIAKLGNVSIQLSLDGHQLEANYCRVKDKGLQDKLLNTLDSLVQAGIEVEIYCVLTKRNCRYLEDFINYILSRYNDSVYIIPFPVRFSARKNLEIDKTDVFYLKKICTNYTKYSSILPPIEYINKLIDLYLGESVNACYIPKVMFQCFDDGVVTPCPNCWTIQSGNLIDNPGLAIDKFHNTRIYRSMTNNKTQFNYCKYCWTDYHILNLYFDNLIKLDDLLNRRLYSKNEAKRVLIALHDFYGKKI